MRREVEGSFLRPAFRSDDIGRLGRATRTLDGQAIPYSAYTEVDPVDERPTRHLRRDERQPCSHDVWMLHEVASHEVVLVSDSVRVNGTRREEEPGRLDGTSTERDRWRRDRELAPGRGNDAHAARGGPQIVRQHLDGRGVGVHGGIGGSLQVISVHRPELRRRAALPCRDVDIASHERLAVDGRKVTRRAILADRLDLAQDRGLVVERQEVVIRDRPASRRQRIPGLEVASVEGSAPSRPTLGPAAKTPMPGLVEVVIGQSRVDADIEILGIRILGRASTLEEHDGQPTADQREREGDPCRTASHDAHVRPDRGSLFNLLRIDQSHCALTDPLVPSIACALDDEGAVEIWWRHRTLEMVSLVLPS